MRRIYIAVALLIISVIIGIFTTNDLKNRSLKHLNYISNMEYYLNKGYYKKAERLSKKAADEFKFTDSKIMYNYYLHRDLDEIDFNLYSMYEYIKRKKETEFNFISTQTKNRLQTIIDKEPVNLENIL